MKRNFELVEILDEIEGLKKNIKEILGLVDKRKDASLYQIRAALNIAEDRCFHIHRELLEVIGT